MNIVKEFFYIALIILLSVLIYTGCEGNKKNLDLLSSVTDSLHKTKDKLNREISSTKVINISYEELKAIHAKDSSSLGKLQKLVTKLTVSAAIISTATKNNFTSATVNLSGDTVKEDSLIYVYPRYHTYYSNKWERFNITAMRDSFKVDYKVFNDFELSQEWKRNGLFKRRTLIASIKNLNPNTETLEYKTFTVSENGRNRLRDFVTGALIGTALNQGARLYFNHIKK